MNNEQEQTQRIEQTLKVSAPFFGEMTFQEFEDIFEDRDPFEFL